MTIHSYWAGDQHPATQQLCEKMPLCSHIIVASGGTLPSSYAFLRAGDLVSCIRWRVVTKVSFQAAASKFVYPAA